jgi:hypothetical protein
MWPEPLIAGTVTPSEVGVADEVTIDVPPIVTMSEEVLVVNPVPAIVTVAPPFPMVGENDVIVGALGADETVKDDVLVTVPFALVMAIGPVVAVAGTVTVRSVVVAELTVAATPLKVTAFWLAVGTKPDPRMVTVVPTRPLDGEKAKIDRSLGPLRVIDRMLPSAS